jgi:hypothetical protein
MAYRREVQDMTTADAHESRRYAKPIVMPERLDLLAGPVTGAVRLPVRLKWCGANEYDLDSPGRIIDLYRTVINEAQAAEDLHTYLHEATLKSLWAYMWLPTAVRNAWEHRFPELEQLRRLASAA